MKWSRLVAVFASLTSVPALAAETAEIQPPIGRIAAHVPPDQRGQFADWFDSVGGPTWYSNYKDNFGRPKTPLLLADVRGDVQSSKLGSYYLHQAGCKPLQKLKNNRTTQAFCALASWRALIETNHAQHRSAFLYWADMLNDGADDGRWIWTIEIPGFALKPPWISGLTQSLGISVLLRAHQLTGEQKYLVTAERAMAWLSKPLSDGGCLSVDENGTWIEEYPNAADPNHVLNGHLWALFGVWDYYRVTRDPRAEKLFREGVKVIKAEVDRYDTGSWIVYSQKNKQDNVIGSYMHFIIEQMKVLHAITQDPFFATYADKWAAYQDNDALFIHMGLVEFEKANEPVR